MAPTLIHAQPEAGAAKQHPVLTSVNCPKGRVRIAPHAGTGGGDDTPPFVAEAVFVVNRRRMRDATAAHAFDAGVPGASSAITAA